MKLTWPRPAGRRGVLVVLAGFAWGPLARAAGRAPAPAPKYRLEHLKGLDSTVVGGVNSAGQVVAQVLDRTGKQYQVILWEGGKTRPLAAPGAASAAAFAISERGEVAGEVTFKEPAGRLAIWRKGKPEYVRLPAGSTHVLPVAMNRRGDVVGGIDTPNSRDLQGFVYRSGKVQRLAMLTGGISSQPAAINERGQIVGEVNRARKPQPSRHAVLWDGGKVRELPTPRGMEGTASDINDHGRIAGMIGDATGHSRAVIWQGDRRVSIGAPGKWIMVSGINNRDEVVGAIGPLDGQTAMLWHSDRHYDLNRLIPSGTGWKLTWAMHVDDRGRIFCLASHGPKAGYVLLTPQ